MDFSSLAIISKRELVALLIVLEPRHEKINYLSLRQLSLIKVFAVHAPEACFLSYPLTRGQGQILTFQDYSYLNAYRDLLCNYEHFSKLFIFFLNHL